VTTLTVPSADIDDLVTVKADTAVSVCIPARDEAGTVSAVVRTAAALRDLGLVDEILVVDDGSTDSTAMRASAAGAQVTKNPLGSGKGQALRTAVDEARGDLLLFLDADVTTYTTDQLSWLIAPLLCEPDVQLVKATYSRSLDGHDGEGGRVTELVARPLLERFHPLLACIAQPLAGESAVRRSALDRLTLADGYGIEVALLIDIHLAYGISAITEVHLGERTHRNRPLSQLRTHARDVLDAILARSPLTTQENQT